MQPSTTIKRMIIEGNEIIVPTYQRAYSWETPKKNSSSKRATHTDVFLSDLEEYSNSNAKSSYYFGHFMYEEKDESLFYIIDGQQRLTTIVIFLSAIFKKLKSFRELSREETRSFEDMVVRDGISKLSTVDYDNQLFKDYVIEQTKTDRNGLDTESAKRIVYAFDYFEEQLANKEEQYLTKMLDIISKASCTTHTVKNESEAIQMFIFQNNRGKKPSNLEVIKAQFMYHVHLYGGNESESLLQEIKNRFEKIYKSISSIEYKIDEDDVLVYTLRVYFNSLWELNAIDKINKRLSEDKDTSFVKEFSQSLEYSFDCLKRFFIIDEPKSYAIHSLVTLGKISTAFPFIIKAYKFGLDTNEIGRLCTSLESLLLRDRLIGTRADITSRINHVFSCFLEKNKSIQPIIDQINRLKIATDSWWAYWNNTELERTIQGGINHSIAKFLLWKYENHLLSQGQSGYSPIRYDTIIKPELEHIAPTTEPTEKHHGYDVYDDDFRNQYLNCLGNYLLLSKSHNSSASNNIFSIKHADYTHLAQQREIQSLVPETGIWDRKIIQERKEKIIQFIIANF